MMADDQGFPQISSPLTDPKTGRATGTFYRLLITLWNRTGGSNNAVATGTFSGEVKLFGGPFGNVPSGWLPCDGSAVSRTSFRALFKAIGTTWGPGDGSTTFNLPPNDKFIASAGATRALGTTGGADNVTLTIDEIPAHTHVVDDPQHTHTFTGSPHTHTITDPMHHHTDGTPAATADVAAGTAKTSAVAGTTGDSATGIVINNSTATGTNSASATGISLEDTGSGNPLSIVPPYAAFNLIIKT